MEREARVYWVRRPEGEKDLLIFDAGYEGGPSISMNIKSLLKLRIFRKRRKRC